MNILIVNNRAAMIFGLLIAIFVFSSCDADQLNSISGPEEPAMIDSPSQTTLSKPGQKLPSDREGNSHNPMRRPGKKKPRHRGEVEYPFPYVKSKTYRFNSHSNQYKGGTISIGRSQGSHFHLNDSALTPPPDIPWGDPVTITMEVDYDPESQAMIFSFDPHGSQFDPPARLKLDYSFLGIDYPELYYIDDSGKRIRQRTDDLNPKKRFVVIYIHHFSRYAVVRG